MGRQDQYAPPAGLPALREALAEEFAVEPESVVVTSGATEALYVLLQSLVGPGDEVVVLEPFFDVYLPDAFLAGAKARLVRLDLTPEGFRLDLSALEKALTPRTRALLLNTPMNPTGLVFGEGARGHRPPRKGARPLPHIRRGLRRALLRGEAKAP